MAFHPGQISFQVGASGGELAPAHPPHQGAHLVAGKVELKLFAQPPEQALQQVGRRIAFAVAFVPGQSEQIGQMTGDILGGQDMVGHACLEGCPGHAVIACGFGFLHQGEAAGRLHRAQSGHAVRAGPGEHHADGRLAFFGGE